MGEQRKSAVAAMLGARSVAVVGASARPDSFGARMIVEAVRGVVIERLREPVGQRGDVENDVEMIVSVFGRGMSA